MRIGIRGLSARVLALLFTVAWLVPGFGAADLVAAWWPDWPRVLEAGWGAFVTAFLAAPSLALVVRPRSVAARALLALAAIVLAVSALASSEPQLLVPAALAALMGRLRLREPVSVSPAVGAVALAGAGPWLAYALDMWAENRGGASADVTMGIEHWAMQGALGLALVVLPLAAALQARLRPLLPLCVGAAAAYLGVVSYLAPGSEGGFGRIWSLAALVWGAAAVSSARPRAGTSPWRSLPGSRRTRAVRSGS